MKILINNGCITRRRATQLLTNREGKGSSGQDFNADRRKSEATSLVDKFSKSVKRGTDTDGESSGTESYKGVTESNGSMSSLRWMVSILVTNNVPDHRPTLEHVKLEESHNHVTHLASAYLGEIVSVGRRYSLQ